MPMSLPSPPLPLGPNATSPTNPPPSLPARTFSNNATSATPGGPVPFGSDTGLVNAYVVTTSPPVTAYRNGLVIAFRALNANTGPSTINLNGLGLTTIVSSTGSPLTAGQIPAGQVVTCVYNGGRFMLATFSSLMYP